MNEKMGEKCTLMLMFLNWKYCTKLLYFFFCHVECAFLIMSGALLHSLFESSTNVFCERFEQPVFSNIPFVLLLVILPLTGISLALKWSGLFEVFIAFHIFVTLIWAIIWLTDSILFFSSKMDNSQLIMI